MNQSPPSKPLSFLRRAMPLVALTVSAALAGAPAWAQAPVAGTSIGNQATATYNDGSNIQRDVQSNSVTTLVQQVAAVDLTDPRTISRSPGAPIAFPHTIQNNGNGTDSFNITLSQTDIFGVGLQIYADANQDGVPDNTTPITATPSLAPGEKFNFVVVGQVPSTQAAGTSGAVTVTATSVNSSAVTDANLDTVNVSNNATIALTKSVAGPAAGGVYTYTLRYTNSSNVDAGSVTITDALNARLIYQNDSGRSNLTGTTVLTDESGDVQSGIDYNVSGAPGAVGTPGRTVTTTIASVPRNSTGTISFNVTLNNSTPGRVPNFATASYDDDNDGGVTTPPITDTSNTVDLSVNLVPSLTFADNILTTPVSQGATVTFVNVLTNTGTGTDTFDITFNAGNTFPPGTTFQLFQPDGTGLNGSATLLDSNNNGIPDTGPLAPGATYNVIVKAKLPAGFSDVGGAPPAAPYSVTLTGTSNGPGKPSDPATDSVPSITASTVELTNRVVTGDDFTGTPVGGRVGQGVLTTAPVLTRTNNPGAVASFPLSAQNNSANNDNYALSFAATPALPAGFSVVFRDTNGQVITNTGNIAPGGFFDYVAEVTIPANASPQSLDLLFSITSGASGATDTILDRLTVSSARALNITPNNQGQVFPGSSVNYAHTVTNNGNATEAPISVTLTDSLAGFSSVVYADNGTGAGEAGNGILDPSELAAGPLTTIPTLAAGANFPIIVKVFGPSNQFTTGAVNTTTITASASNGTTTITASATDLTTIVAGDVTLTKSQSVNGGAQTQGNATALPGQTISYQILVRNTGGAPVTNVVVSDNTPAFTTYTTTGGAASFSIDGGAATAATSAPNSGSAGTITWTIPTLNPGSVATVTFNVVINN